jgi:hypothetical protein
VNGVGSQAMMTQEDAFYFGHHGEVALPVYRVIVDDAELTRYYLDPVSGAVLRRADSNARWHRFLFAGLHRLDFTAGLRARPLWDVIMITLLLGGIGVSATGVYLAIRRIRVDVAAAGSQPAAAKAAIVPPRS